MYIVQGMGIFLADNLPNALKKCKGDADTVVLFKPSTSSDFILSIALWKSSVQM